MVRIATRFVVELILIGVLPVADCKPIAEIASKIAKQKYENI